MVYNWSQNSPEEVLSKRFHLQQFHAGQREIIEHLVQGKRVLAIQRTGWGKSLCYQMASLYFPYLTLVFSPLKALMRDQCKRCNEVYQMAAAIVSSDFSEEENNKTLDQAVMGKIKILYIAPERLDNVAWQGYVSRMRISMVIVDEAHCISTWGHDFRPHYCRIVTLLNALPANLPVLALTATANQRVEQDIRQQIGRDALVVRGSMYRANLHLNVVQTHEDAEKLSYLAANIPLWPGSGLVYTGTQRSAEMVAAFLQQQGIEAEYYHAGREDSERQRIEQGLMANAYKVICSTNALGMGIDKPDIRFVVHYHIPASPIHYYQEIGRAGRDGKSSRCVLLYDAEDLAIQQHFINGAKPSARQYEMVLTLVKNEIQGWRFTDLLRITGFSRNVLQNILIDLEDRGLIQRLKFERNTLYVSRHLRRVDDDFYKHIQQVRIQKEQELADMQNYAGQKECFMGYLTVYLGDAAGQGCGTCGNCGSHYWPDHPATPQLANAVTYFIEQTFLPRLAKRGTINQPEHEAGWALSDHGSTRIGKLVRACKYEEAGPFPDELILRAVEIVRTRYPIEELRCVTSVPPTKSGTLVEDFARRVANILGLKYVSIVTKQRVTQEQKTCTNAVQKKENVKGAFAVQESAQIMAQSLLLIDDIYDSGYTLREVAATLRRVGAKAVYPLTITKTLHSDDQ